MANGISLANYFLTASVIVKSVMLILGIASITSWTYIIERGWLIKRIRQVLANFENNFWSGIDLNKLYIKLSPNPQGIEAIFTAGFAEFIQLRKQTLAPVIMLEGIQRAMRIAYSREIERLEKHLAFLASVGSISPYIGLFGTVWGIMTSLQSLGTAQQATIAMVAPGIAEALIATAIGLFAAIPAVIAYNRYINEINRLSNRYDTFSEEFINLLSRQLYAKLGQEYAIA